MITRLLLYCPILSNYANNSTSCLEKIKKSRTFSLDFWFAWRRPALTKGNPSLQSALRSLTSVFGMGTGVSFSLSPPHYLIMSKIYSLKTGIEDGISNKSKIFYFIWLSPRTISISPLRTSLHFHS